MKNDENTVDTSEDQQEQSTPADMRSETDSNRDGTESKKTAPVDVVIQAIKKDKDGTESKKTAPGRIYHIIGMIATLFGAFIFLYLFVAFAEEQQMLFSTSKSELTFGEVVIAFGAAMIFIVPGVICIGIGKIIDLLDK